MRSHGIGINRIAELASDGEEGLALAESGDYDVTFTATSVPDALPTIMLFVVLLLLPQAKLQFSRSGGVPCSETTDPALP